MKHILNAANIKNLKPREGRKLTKYHDGEGLYLWVYDDGKKKYKRWFYRYRYNKKSMPEILLGSFSKVSAAEARKKADEMRELLKNGIDPARNRKAKKLAKEKAAGNSFEVVAREWHATQTLDCIPKHRTTIMQRLEKDVIPFIGDIPINDLKSQDFLIVARRVEERGALDVAKRILGYCSKVCKYAVITNRREYDPCRDLQGALKKSVVKHRAATIDKKGVGEILRMVDGYKGTFIVRCALKLAPLLFVRPGELRTATWCDIDFDKAEWSLQITKTQKKGVSELIVPLSNQAIEILKELKKVSGRGKFVFPSPRSPKRPMSNNAVLAAFRSMGISKEEMSGHGWRAVARTLLDEELNYPAHIIEHQLGHTVKDPNGRAYNRTKHLAKRKVMMQAWADYLDKLREG